MKRSRTIGRMLGAAAVLLLIGGVSTPAMANMVADPGFDDASGGGGTWGSWGATDFNTWGGHLPDWWGASVAFYANTAGNSGGIFDWGISGAAGETYDLSVDMWIQEVFDAKITIGFEYMAADNNSLLGSDFLELMPGDVYISDGSEAEEWMRWQTYGMTGTPAPAGTAFVRPFIKYDSVSAASSEWFFGDNVVVTPEPSGLAVLVFGGLAVVRRRR